MKNNFIIPKYKIGGAENVMIALARELSKYDTEIFFCYVI